MKSGGRLAAALRLAARAEVCRSSAQNDSLDRSSARRTRLPRAVVNAMEQLETTGHPVRVHVVAQATAAVLDRAAEDALDRPIQSPDVVLAQVARRARRVNAGEEERLVHIDIAEAGDQPLVEQGGLNRAPRAGQSRLQ